MTDIMTDPQAASTTSGRDQQLAALYAYLQWAEQHPDAELAVTCIAGDHQALYRVLHVAWTASDLADLAAKLGGQWKKDIDASYFWLTQEVVPGVSYELYAPRNIVCERVVTGTEDTEITEPDPALVAQLPTITRTETREIVEWRCPDSILAAARA